MDFETIKITDIIPAEYNPRVMSEDEKTKLKNSINEFGLVDPIIINLKNNTIIGGHQRFDVLLDQYIHDNDFYADLKLIRLGDIGWVFPEEDLTLDDPAKEKALNLVLNRVSGEWDLDKLGEVFSDLRELDFDIDLTGFSEYDEEVHFTNLMDKVEFDDNRLKSSSNSLSSNRNNTDEDIIEDDVDGEVTEPDNDTIDDDAASTETKEPGYYQITILFDTEEEMVTEYDNLISQGYTCRMSDS